MSTVARLPQPPRPGRAAHLAHAAAALALVLAACGGGDAATAPPPAGAPRLAVSPHAHSVVVGASLGFTATVTDAQGRPMASAPVAWRSSTPGVATVDAGGTATGRAAGQAMIVALLDGVPRDSAVLTVVAPTSGGTGPAPGTPATGTPGTETPGTETPGAGTPGTGTPGNEAPGDSSVVPGTGAPTVDARCGGIAQLRLLTGAVGFNYAHTRRVAEDSLDYVLASSADMSFALPRAIRGTHGVTWTGTVSSGRVRIDDVRTDWSYDTPRVTTIEGSGQAERDPDSEPASVVTIAVDLRRCTYVLSFTAAVVARVDDAEGPFSVGSFTSPSLRWDQKNSYSVAAPVHSPIWVTARPRSGPYFVSGGFAEELFFRGRGNDVEGEGSATVTFSFGGER